MTRITATNDPLKVLLIEDSRGDAILIEKALQSALSGAYKMVRVSNLEDAINAVAQDEFDVALLDRSLPDVSGFEALHSLQNRAPALPIVFLTAYKDEHTAFEAIEQGAQDYLFKDALDGHIIKRALQYAVLRKQFEGILIMRANFDMLTGLANRTLFESRLDMALTRMKRHGGNVAVLYLDLDRFKHVNDTMGHIAGDALLKQVGARIKSVLRPYDTAARLGGDEFAVLLENIGCPEAAETVARKLIAKITTPFELHAGHTEIGVSIGIAYNNGAHPMTGDQLMKDADTAMYEAKQVHNRDLVAADIIVNEPANKIASLG